MPAYGAITVLLKLCSAVLCVLVAEHVVLVDCDGKFDVLRLLQVCQTVASCSGCKCAQQYVEVLHSCGDARGVCTPTASEHRTARKSTERQ